MEVHTEMNIAFSPCPNDTFIFHAWTHGLVNEAPRLNVTYADIDQTNYWAAHKQGPEVLKISYAALPWVLEDYQLLPCGGALGRGCGPLVLVKGNGSDAGTLQEERNRSTAASVDPASLSGRRVAIPSDRSTAYLLFRLWAAEHVPGGFGEIIVKPFHEIMPAVRDGLVDAGLVIHEARFTYPAYGLTSLADMGSWWESSTGLPIPLGAIIARRTIDSDRVVDWIRGSLDYAWSHPEDSRDYILHHAQEMDPDVAKAHIQLYVNEFSMNLGQEGYNAVESLLGRASEQGLVPVFDLGLLR
jgi:1,4-dihydroxy-6-naphthoate synthase